MADTNHLPFGTWPSPLTPENLGSLREVSELAWTPSGGLLWLERVSSRSAILLLPPGGSQPREVSGGYQPAGAILYGGGSYGPGTENLVFRDRDSGQLYQASLAGGTIQPLTSDLTLAASPRPSPSGSGVLFVHSDGETDCLGLLTDQGSQWLSLDDRADFYNYPRWHPDGARLAWMSWNHPSMPWDSSSIWLGELGAGSAGLPRIRSRILIAGGEGISALQPEFSPDGKQLAYLSDQNGWWQLYLYDLASQTHRQLTSAPAEHALPPWLQSRGAYGFSPDSRRIYFLRNQNARRSLWVVDLETGQESLVELAERYTWLDWLAVSPREDRIALVASAGDLPPRLISVNPSGECTVIRRTSPESISRKAYTLPRALRWENPSGGGVHGLHYPPRLAGGQPAGQPPLLLMIHSGPTRQKFAEFQPRSQYFASRGFAVLEVNYRGSSGYGRDYRQSLQGQWGLADVEDCLSGALYLADQGWADRERMFLLGSSSGGLTVFQILVRYPGVFRAGITLYAIVNHLDLLEEPPKFERHYSDWLIGPYPAAAEAYRERSPVFFADRIRDPVAVFQGGRDPIVPQTQAEQIIQALQSNGVSCQYTLYPEEGHGFKRTENIADFYRRTEDFLQQYLMDQ